MVQQRDRNGTVEETGAEINRTHVTAQKGASTAPSSLRGRYVRATEIDAHVLDVGR
jgi:hypothetical protein